MTDQPTSTGQEPHGPPDGPDETPARPDGSTRDPLLDRAERIAELPLDERPAAFEGLDRAVVAELQSLEED